MPHQSPEVNSPLVRPLFSRQALMRLIIPLIIEQLLAMTIGMADTLMVTSVSEAAVSGVSLVDSISMLLINVFSALATGGAVVAAQYLGSRDHDNACRAAKQLLYSITAVAAVLMVVALVFRRQILLLVFGNIEGEVMSSAMTYFLLTAISYPMLAVYNAGAALYRSMGNSKVSMFSSLLMNILNIGINAWLIYGFQMGVAGAGIGTLVSRFAGAAIMLVLVCNQNNPIHIERLFHPDFHWPTVKKILKIGVPNGLENGMFQVGKLLVAGLITTFGTAAIAANAIANSICSVANVPGNAMSLALITVVGQCMGAGDPKQAVKYTQKMMIIVYLSMGTLNAIMFFAAAPLVSCFSLSPAAAVMAEQVIQWFSVFAIVFWPMAFALPNALRAAGDAKFTMFVSMFSMWTFRIGFSYLFAQVFSLGLFGVWLAMFVDWIVRAGIFLWRFWRGKWKTKRVI